LLGEREICDFPGLRDPKREVPPEFPDWELSLVTFISSANPLFSRRSFRPDAMSMAISAITDLSFSLRLARPGELSELVRIDDAAGTLYAQVGIVFDFGWEHPFAKAEMTRWDRAIERGLAHVAVDQKDTPLGFITLEAVDGDPYIHQLSVHPMAMRRGIGSSLVRKAIAWSGGRPLWLTTYSQVPWNLPYYKRKFDFSMVPEEECGEEMIAILASERAILPQPECRVAMVLRKF
jgi:ribosomal protein S18 acetylase RimI-like enzyme